MSKDVNVLKLFPGIKGDLIKCAGNIPGLRAIIMESFGSGNAPSNKDVKEGLKAIIDKGIIVLNITQCHGGSVEQNKYSNGQYLERIGVIGGEDLTTEAALTKLMFLLGKSNDNEEVIKDLKRSLRGEMTIA